MNVYALVAVVSALLLAARTSWHGIPVLWLVAAIIAGLVAASVLWLVYKIADEAGLFDALRGAPA